MSNYGVGDKFVLEIKEIDNLKNHMVLENIAVGTDMLDKLERLDSDYVNEHFGELQDEAYQAGEKTGIETALKWDKDNQIDMYQQGLNDAWKAAKRFFADMEEKTLEQIFGADWSFYKIMNMSPQEALAKLEAYEEEKAKNETKAELEIKVGDVVEYEGGLKVVTAILADKDYVTINLIGNDGLFALSWNINKCKKTGKHIDIQSIFNQLGGCSNADRKRY